jgi:hypothetical protein
MPGVNGHNIMLQSSDKKVNQITPTLFNVAGDAEKMAAMSVRLEASVDARMRSGRQMLECNIWAACR